MPDDIDTAKAACYAADKELTRIYALGANKRYPESEAILIKDPDAALEYAADFIEGRWPEAEAVIASNALTANAYAYRVINGRWPMGEPAISQDAWAACRYADTIIKGRWPPGEEAIFDDGHYVKLYMNVLWLQDPEAYAELELERGDWLPDAVAEAALTKARTS